jgi:hypothetical protein
MSESTREEVWAKIQPDGTMVEAYFTVIESDSSTTPDVVEVEYDLFVQLLSEQHWSQRANPEAAEDNRRDLTDRSAASGPAIVNPDDGPDQADDE